MADRQHLKEDEEGIAPAGELAEAPHHHSTFFVSFPKEGENSVQVNTSFQGWGRRGGGRGPEPAAPQGFAQELTLSRSPVPAESPRSKVTRW